MLKKLAKGTLILTITTIITRLIGFIYKMYLTKIMTADTLGIYQLIFPVYGIGYIICAYGIQTYVSQMTAKNRSRQEKSENILAAGLMLSFFISVIVSVFICFLAEYIGKYYLGSAECIPLLKILCFSMPFCGISNCITGYYYGMLEGKQPAFALLYEQIFKVIFVWVLCCITDTYPKVYIAVWGIVFSELLSAFYLICKTPISFKGTSLNLIIKIIKGSYLYTITRLATSILHSFETILLPLMLRKFGMSQRDSVAMLGIINGMVYPILMFPTTIGNSMSVFLLPFISENRGDRNKLWYISIRCLIISAFLGLLSVIMFLFAGDFIGMYIFENEKAGELVKTLSFVCLITFVEITYCSIINGLSMVKYNFLISVISLTVQLIIMVTTIPVIGLNGYIISVLVSGLINVSLSGIVVNRTIK